MSDDALTLKNETSQNVLNTHDDHRDDHRDDRHGVQAAKENENPSSPIPVRCTSTTPGAPQRPVIHSTFQGTPKALETQFDEVITTHS